MNYHINGCFIYKTSNILTFGGFVPCWLPYRDNRKLLTDIRAYLENAFRWGRAFKTNALKEAFHLWLSSVHTHTHAQIHSFLVKVPFAHSCAHWIRGRCLSSAREDLFKLFTRQRRSVCVCVIICVGTAQLRLICVRQWVCFLGMHVS